MYFDGEKLAGSAEEKIMALLRARNAVFEEFVHEPVYTCEEAARVRGVPLSDGIKCLLLKSDTRFFLAITRGNRRLDLKSLASLEGVKTIRLASAGEVEKIANCAVGCVHPFCDVNTYVDDKFLNDEFIEFNPGVHNKTVRMRSSDLTNLLHSPVYASFSTAKNQVQT